MATYDFNRKITIQQASQSQDALGGPINAWTTYLTCWASIDIQQSQLIYSTAEFMEKTTHRITIWWSASYVFRPSMRIVYIEPANNVTHTYNIEAVINEVKQGNQYLTFLCYELDGAE